MAQQRINQSRGLDFMYSVISCLIIGTGIFFASCNGNQRDEKGETPQISVNSFSRSKDQSSLKIDFPQCSNVVLQQNILEWINDQLGGTYEGDLNDNDAMFNHYADRFCIDDGEFGEYQKLALTKAYENSNVVTYRIDSEDYGGGYHATGAVYGQTFRKSDGKIFSNSFIDYSKLRNQVIQGLKNYFEGSSDDELLEILQIDGNSLDRLPPPSLDPWIMDDGVHFLYTFYEIAPYAAGTPTFTIPFESIKPAVNATAKTFFN